MEVGGGADDSAKAIAGLPTGEGEYSGGGGGRSGRVVGKCVGDCIDDAGDDDANDFGDNCVGDFVGPLVTAARPLSKEGDLSDGEEPKEPPTAPEAPPCPIEDDEALSGDALREAPP